MKKVITLITFLLTINFGFSQSISPRLWVNNTYYVFDSIHSTIYFEAQLDTISIVLEETDSISLEIHHTMTYHNILSYNTAKENEFFNPETNFCTQDNVGIGQVQIQGTKIDYMPYILADDTFFCQEEEIIFVVTTYSYLPNVDQNFHLLYIKCIRPSVVSLQNEFSFPIIKLFPNPTSDWLTIDVVNFKDASKITLFDIYGSVVKELVINNSQDQQNVNVSDLTEGIYFVSIKNNQEQLFTQKLVISK
jgi:hypothetical protein